MYGGTCVKESSARCPELSLAGERKCYSPLDGVVYSSVAVTVPEVWHYVREMEAKLNNIIQNLFLFIFLRVASDVCVWVWVCARASV